MKWNSAAEYISLVFVLVLIFYSWDKEKTNSLKNRIFRLFLQFVFFEILLSILSIIAIENYSQIPSGLNQTVQLLYFLLTPLLSLLFTQYMIAVGWEEDKRIKSYLYIVIIPYILYSIFVISNLFTHSLYSIDEVLGFTQGKLFILTYVIHLLYILLMFIIAYFSRFKLTQRLPNVLLSFPVISLTMLMLQLIYPEIILSGSAAALVSLIVYLYLQDKQQLELKQSEERFRNLFTLKGDAIFVIDRLKGDILEVNDSACTIYGYSRNEMLKLKNTDMSYEPKATEKAAKEFEGGYTQIPLRYHKKKDETVFPVEINATFFTWKNREAILVVSKDITDRKISENKLIYLSYHDQLTGLYNRRFFEEELVRLDTKRNLPISIAMGDVNGLKMVNDSFGHLKGDQLLKSVAFAMQKACREDDIIARLGGDEFAIILPNTNSDDTEKVISRIMEIANEEKVDGLNISISFGHQTKTLDQENMNTIIREAEERMYRLKLNESSSMRNKTVTLIMNTLFEKNNREMEHSQRVSEISVKIAIEMGLDKDSLNRLRTAALMHDIGKIGIDEEILNSKTILTQKEWIEVKKHSEIGYRILASSTDFSDIAEDVYAHHERWDGNGYPRGIDKDHITIFARIISIADSYDAMISERPYRFYRKSMSIDEAIKEIKKNAGTQFDPSIAKIFVEKVMHYTW
ncbi:MAG: diguanylate cyclase [Erysipelotrichaceae bacterium]|nr:diguanylate cyclase [Erysipelotrichaceae bacterium]